jgi:hypothetical protein
MILDDLDAHFQGVIVSCMNGQSTSQILVVVNISSLLMLGIDERDIYRFLTTSDTALEERVLMFHEASSESTTSLTLYI